tara:strand:- start:765 stop:1097 length:333 start_codon:yes stop_codon:yes gene_type:complete
LSPWSAPFVGALSVRTLLLTFWHGVGKDLQALLVEEETNPKPSRQTWAEALIHQAGDGVAEIKATTPHSDKAQPCMPASAPRRRRRIRQTRQATRGYRRLQTRLLSWSTS